MLVAVERLIRQKESDLTQEQPESSRTFIGLMCLMHVVDKYFGGFSENCIELRDMQYTPNSSTGNSEARLSDFKGKGAAACVERSLALAVCTQVIQNDEFVRANNLFPYEASYHKTKVAGDMTKIKPSNIGNHAVCVLFPNAESTQPIVLLDSAMTGKYQLRGQIQRGYAIYQIDGKDEQDFCKGEPIVPKMMITKLSPHIKQVSHRGYCTNNQKLLKANQVLSNSVDR